MVKEGLAQPRRKDPTTMAAKALVYHYAVFVDQIQVYRLDTANPGISYTTSGIAELGGNDLIVSLGGWGKNKANIDANVAGTFMHELGHNLGLDHGGGDGVNNKPNYQSVMNY